MRSTTENLIGFSDKLLQPSLRPRLLEYIDKKTTSGPVVVELDPTTACNSACPECVNLNQLNQGQIESERLKNLMVEFKNAGVKGIIFIGGGEPLLHPSMPQPLADAFGLDIQVGLTTNGLLTDRFLPEIADFVDWTRVSVDAASAQTYSIFRPSGKENAFETVIENMADLAKVKSGLLGYSFMIIERKLPNGKTISNIDELYKAAVLAKEAGCDYFEYKPTVDKDHHLIPLSEQAREGLLKQAEDLKRLESYNFKVFSPKSLGHLISGSTPDQKKDYQTCPVSEFRTLVTKDGIYPCPYKRGIQEKMIGSINQPFDEYWKSEERVDKMASLNPSTDCTFYCIRDEVNIFLNELSKSNDEKNPIIPPPANEAHDVFI
ncbi:MAG: radical SAM protein [Candidatus Levybacteria bacterium]|nr:radical SAM protein [Candidatus Levybacteria bacterium]